VEKLCVRPAFCPELQLVTVIGKNRELSPDSSLYRKIAERRGILSFFSLANSYDIKKQRCREFHLYKILCFLGNPISIESLSDRDDSRSVYCFPSEIYASRSANNPYTSLKNRSCHSKQSSNVHRVDSYDYKKLSSHDDDKSYGLTNLRRKSLSSCDLFHVTSKTLSSPFDEIQNWLTNKRKLTIKNLSFL
jgi:hypothetical protein